MVECFSDKTTTNAEKLSAVGYYHYLYTYEIIARARARKVEKRWFTELLRIGLHTATLIIPVSAEGERLARRTLGVE